MLSSLTISSFDAHILIVSVFVLHSEEVIYDIFSES